MSHPGRTIAVGVTLGLVIAAAFLGLRHIRQAATPGRSLETVPATDVQPTRPTRPTRSADSACAAMSEPPARVDHVLWIWMENENGDVVNGSPSAPYLSSLGAQCGIATAYSAIGHPSLPNYLAATSGLPLSALRAFVSDRQPAADCHLSGTGIFSLVPSWRAYEESMPVPCAPTNKGTYLARHNPPVYYADLADCATNDVPYDRLATDLATGQLPAFSFVTPNSCHDMHSCPIATGDAWLATEVPKILSSPAYRDGKLVVFITFDEGRPGRDGQDCLAHPDPSCNVLTVVVSPWTTPGTSVSQPYNHYSLLRTTLELLGASTFPGEALTAPSMRTAFRL